MMNAQFMNGQPQQGYGSGNQQGYGSGTQPGYGAPASFPPGAGPHPVGSGPPAANSMMPASGQQPMMGPPPPGPGGASMMKPGAHNGANPGGYGPPSTGMPSGQSIRGPTPGQHWSPNMQSVSDSSGSLSNQMNGLSVSGSGRGQPPMPGQMMGSGPPRPGLPPGSAGPRPPFTPGQGLSAGQTQSSFPPGPSHAAHGPPGTMNQGPPSNRPPGVNQGFPPTSQGPPGGNQGFPSTSQGPPGMNQGFPPTSQGPPGGNQGFPPTSQAPPGVNQGFPSTSQGPPGGNQGFPSISQGPPGGNQGFPPIRQGPPGMSPGFPPTSQGPPGVNQPPSSYGHPGGSNAPPLSSQGPPGLNQGVPPGSHAPPMMTNQGRSGVNQGPSPINQGPPGANQGPPTINQGPPGINQRPPSVNQGPPMMNQRPTGVQPHYSGVSGMPPGGMPPGGMPPGGLPAGPGGAPPSQGYAPPQSQGYGPPPPGGMPGSYQSGPPPGPGMQPGPRPGGPMPPPGGIYPGQPGQGMVPGPPPPRGMSGPPPLPAMGGHVSQTSMNFGSDSPVPGPMGPGYQSSGAAMGGGYPQPGGPQGHRPMAGPGPLPSQPQQPRRLDPDHMPSPIQVMEDDRRNRGGLFQTGQRGIVPPLVTTSFITEDQGACSPRFLRSTMYNIPCTADLLKQSHIPFALTLVPFARLHPKENPPPIVDLGQMGPIRCNRCKAYMCPYMLFVDGGRKFQCSFCGCNTEVPPEYFAHLDHTGRRIDCYDRPELCLGAYEFVATADYCKDGKLPNPPAYIFMIDVSYNSVKSGLVDLLCARLKDEVLSCLPKDVGDEESEIRVGFVTYAKELHFYNIKETLAQPQMLVVSDVHDVFVPLLDGFFVKVSEAEQIIDSLLTQISQVFSDSRETETILGPVIQAGLDALQSAQRSGKLIIFHSSLPTADAPGKLTNRDDRKLLGTDKEKTLLSASSNFYTKLAGECVAAGCSVDLYLFPNTYADVASVSEVPRLTGGSLQKYTYFQSDLDGDLLISDLITNISRPVAFDAVVRVRTSTGIRAVDFYGNFFMSNTTDVELACVDSDKSISIEIKHDDKLTEAEGAFVQAAILYTSVGGRRRLRVLNVAFNCCTQIADLFRNCELDVLVNFMAKQSIRECLNSNSRQVRDNLMNTCSQILACYRKNCASPSSSGQLILPECMKLLPVYTNCVIKSGILQSVEINTDDRSYSMYLVNAMSVIDSNVYFYPRLMPLHEVDVNSTALPTPMRGSSERLRDNGVYLLENGLVMFIWIGLGVNPEWVRDVFNCPSAAQIDIDKTRLQEIDNPLSKRVRQIVRRVRDERHRHMKLIIVRQRDKLEPVFHQYLVEDRGNSGSSSYVDFLCHIHKEIRSLLN